MTSLTVDEEFWDALQIDRKIEGRERDGTGIADFEVQVFECPDCFLITKEMVRSVPALPLLPSEPTCDL